MTTTVRITMVLAILIFVQIIAPNAVATEPDTASAKLFQKLSENQSANQQMAQTKAATEATEAVPVKFKTLDTKILDTTKIKPNKVKSAKAKTTARRASAASAKVTKKATKKFIPTEKVSEDLAVSFPVDI